MIDETRLEALLESLDSEIQELPESTARDNLIDISSALYGIFEDIMLADVEKTKQENEVLRQLLTAYLSYEDKLYIRFKYEVDLS